VKRLAGSGFAALVCGKAVPFRQAFKLLRGCASNWRNDRARAAKHQKRRCLFRSVPLARGLCGTKMGKKAYFCYRLLQARGSTVKQRSRKTPILCLTVSQARGAHGETNIAKNAHFCPSLSHPKAFTLGQTSTNFAA
jgi:hypothetical protein